MPLRRDQGKTPFLLTVASELVASPERARFLAQAVLSVLDDQHPPTAEAVRSELPEDFTDLFASLGDGPAPDRAATAALPEPTDLTADEVSAALTGLPGWTGDERGLERTVVLPPGVGQELRDRISRVEQEMNHHAAVEKRADGTVFRVWTHARGVVTDLDIELARRISDVIED
jgi:4a-hydroxytetrahydrobiopterin dehydratase